MRNNNIVILHVFSDGIIFSKVADNYDSMSGVENLYYYYSRDKEFKFQNISDSRVKVFHNFKDYVKLFSDPEIDAILFYALPYHYYYLFNYIDDSKFVIWWAWGYDIYYRQGKYPPLINIKGMYKPLTQKYMESHEKPSSWLSITMKRFLRLPKIVMTHFNSMIYEVRPLKTQEEILSRIDSFYAPLDVEYDYMRDSQCAFNAQRHPGIIKNRKVPLKIIKVPNNVLVNHSLTYTDNHLDVFDLLNKVIIDKDRKFVIPVSYGIDGYNGKPENLIKASCLDEHQVMWLTKVLPQNEYEDVLSSVSHAIFGAIRQQALGNIYNCLLRGVKVYMYEDSILYKELKKKGYVIFTIESDLTTDSLSQCLCERDARTNHDVYVQWLKDKSPEKCSCYLKTAIQQKKQLSN